MPMPIWTQIRIWNLTYSPPSLHIGTHGEGCLLYLFCIFVWQLRGLFGCYWRTVWRSWILYMALTLHFLLLIVFHLFLFLVPLFVHHLIPKQWWSRTARWATKHTEKIILGRGRGSSHIRQEGPISHSESGIPIPLQQISWTSSITLLYTVRDKTFTMFQAFQVNQQ